jgi:hypothetical protein
MKIIEAGLKLNDGKDHDAHRDTDGESGDIDESVIPVAG